MLLEDFSDLKSLFVACVSLKNASKMFSSACEGRSSAKLEELRNLALLSGSLRRPPLQMPER